MPFDTLASLLFRQWEAATAQPVSNPTEWVQLSTAIDALRSLLEDSYVDWPEGLVGEVQKVQESAATDTDALISLIIKIAQLEPLPFDTDLREIPCGSSHVEYRIRRAREGNRGFLLSTGEVRTLPVLDDTLTDEALAAGLIDAYAAAVKVAQAEFGVTYLAFIDKNFGPIGALGLIAALVAKTGLPAVVYRERKWSKKADFSRYRPAPGEKGVIIYDLVNTGAAIRGAAERISEEFTATVSAAVVLYNLSDTITAVDAAPGKAVVVLALDGVAGPSSLLKSGVNHEERELASSGSVDDSRSFPRGEEMSKTRKKQGGATELSYRQRLQRILDNPRAAQEVFPDPELRAKALPLYDSLLNLAGVSKDDG